MRVADYIFKSLADRGVRHAFLVTGGGAMHLNDALRLEKRIRPVCCHHEQACAIAAEGYFRASGRMPVVSVTSGPGGTNALTGVMGAWLDSIPMLIASGQVKFTTTIASCPDVKLRQLGDQEINIIDIVRPVTKYAKMLTTPNQVVEELDKAFNIAVSGRPGPVWLDIPLDVQGAVMNLDMDHARHNFTAGEDGCDAWQLSRFYALMEDSKRPVVIAGHGIELDRAESMLDSFLEAFRLPVLTTFCGMNVLESDHPLNFGRIGTLGQRAANFILQSADLVVSIGSRNNIRQVGYNWEGFAPRAKKVSVDIDNAELRKPTLKIDLPICCSAGKFLTACISSGRTWENPEWIDWCKERTRRFPAHTAEQENCNNGVNPYHFMRVLTDKCPPDATIVAGNGVACVALFQTGVVKKGQRQFWNSGCASMGYDLPAALGAAVATDKLTVCLAGDGSAMMNLQELETIIYNRLPVKIFLLDNGGYCSIRQTQRNLFSDELMGCGPADGVGMPDYMALAKAFGYDTCEISSHNGIDCRIEEVLSGTNPAFCVVRIPREIGFAPKLAAKRLPDGSMLSPSLENMSPFLPTEIINENTITE